MFLYAYFAGSPWKAWEELSKHGRAKSCRNTRRKAVEAHKRSTYSHDLPLTQGGHPASFTPNRVLTLLSFTPIEF